MTTNDSPYMYWVGMNTPGASDAELEKFHDFYNKVHVPEVVGFQGFQSGTRYELFQQDTRGDFAPRWLVNYQIGSEEALQSYLARSEGPPENRPKYTQGPESFRNNTTADNTPWRMIWRRLHPTEGTIDNDAEYLNVIGMNLPADATEEEHQQFNDFYNYTHMPEIIEALIHTGAARYELYKTYRDPATAPQYLAAYEGGDESIQIRKARLANRSAYPLLSAGPPIWAKRLTAWNATYRRI